MNDHDTHPPLTEPEVTAHLRDGHGWSPMRCYLATYFERLVAHSREHRKQRMSVAS